MDYGLFTVSGSADIERLAAYVDNAIYRRHIFDIFDYFLVSSGEDLRDIYMYISGPRCL
jgi:hypothetical protein